MSDTITPEERAILRDKTSRGQASPYDMRLVLNALDAEQAEAQVARLKAERDYLANELGERDGSRYPHEWKEAARKAVAAHESSVTTTICPACKGKGGAEYEPGLIIYECKVCGGSGVVEARKAVDGEGK